MRIERDEIGEKILEDGCLYGLQALRARENFGSIGGPVKGELIKALVVVKKAAAMSYLQLEKDGPEHEKWEYIIRCLLYTSRCV